MRQVGKIPNQSLQENTRISISILDAHPCSEIRNTAYISGLKLFKMFRDFADIQSRINHSARTIAALYASLAHHLAACKQRSLLACLTNRYYWTTTSHSDRGQQLWSASVKVGVPPCRCRQCCKDDNGSCLIEHSFPGYCFYADCPD